MQMFLTLSNALFSWSTLLLKLCLSHWPTNFLQYNCVNNLFFSVVFEVQYLLGYLSKYVNIMYMYVKSMLYATYPRVVSTGREVPQLELHHSSSGLVSSKPFAQQISLDQLSLSSNPGFMEYLRASALFSSILYSQFLNE